MADARHLPQAGLERGDRHLNFYETRDNLLKADPLLLGGIQVEHLGVVVRH